VDSNDVCCPTCGHCFKDPHCDINHEITCSKCGAKFLPSSPASVAPAVVTTVRNERDNEGPERPWYSISCFHLILLALIVVFGSNYFGAWKLGQILICATIVVLIRRLFSSSIK